jgi:acetyl-CoA carboxylase biotin carboxyl carrier protein
MDFKKLKEFIDIAKDAGAAELEYEDGEKKFSVSFGVAQTATVLAGPHISSTPIASLQQSNEATSKDNGLLEVTSPFVGTFYRSTSPETAPYAKIGDRVSNGQVLCIIEAMKIMNEIETEVSGEIVEICVENENYVEFGQVLFRIKP